MFEMKEEHRKPNENGNSDLPAMSFFYSYFGKENTFIDLLMKLTRSYVQASINRVIILL